MDDTPPSVPDPFLPGLAGAGLAPVEPQVPRVLPPFAPSPPSRVHAGVSWRAMIAFGLIAFLVGLGVAAFLVTKYAKVGDTKTIATVTAPVGGSGQSPVVVVPSKASTMPAIDLAALSSREAELTARIGELEARSGAIDRDSQRAASYATRGEGLMIAFAARRAIDRGLGLGFIEEQVRTRFGAAQPAAVATVIQAARAPVTLEDLRAGLDGVAPELMTGAASNGWWQSLRSELDHLVVLRKAGTPSPLPIDRVARARRLVEAGQVEAALAEVSRTPGAARAERWTSAARRYIDARRALDTLEGAAILMPEADPAVPEPVSAPAPVTLPTQ